MENVKDAACHIPAVLDRVKREYIAKTYKVSSWNDPTDFLEQVAQRTGKLLKVDKVTCFVMVNISLTQFAFCFCCCCCCCCYCCFYLLLYFIHSSIPMSMFRVGSLVPIPVKP